MHSRCLKAALDCDVQEVEAAWVRRHDWGASRVCMLLQNMSGCDNASSKEHPTRISWTRLLTVYHTTLQGTCSFIYQHRDSSAPPRQGDANMSNSAAWLSGLLSRYYVKSAQIMASKTDFLPIQWTQAMTPIFFDNMEPRRWHAVKQVTERNECELWHEILSAKPFFSPKTGCVGRSSMLPAHK